MIPAWHLVRCELPLLLLLSAAVVACSEPTTQGAGGQLAIVHAPDSAGVPGWPLRDTLVVRVTDNGAPRGGAVVEWTVRQGGGTVEPLSDTTDAAGYVAALWTLGQRGPNRLRASTLDGDSATFAVIASVFRADVFDSQYKLGCGLVSGAVWCWGGAVGINPSPSIGPPVEVFDNEEGGTTVLVDDSRQYVGIAVSQLDFGFCALDAAGGLRCGTRSDVSGASPLFTITEPNGIPALSTIVSAHDYSTGGDGRIVYCGLAVADSTAWCIDSKGIGSAVAGSPALTSLVAGEGWYCGIRADSLAVCWGNGPLGDGVTLSSASPVEVAGDHRFVKLRSDKTYACGLAVSAAVYCWSAGEIPVWMADGVSDLAVDLSSVLVLQGGTLKEFAGRVSYAESLRIDPLTGLDGLRVTDLASGSTSCVRLVGGEIYCFDELWISSSAELVFSYSPVQPPPSDSKP